MRTMAGFILGCALLIGCFPPGAAAADGDTIEVIATGIGRDSDSALKNALRAAIEQAVGALVDSETLIDNDEVVNDQILSYSAGFVQSHKMIGEPKTTDGLVSVKIQARVKRTQLAEKLKASNISIKEVDGASLFGEAITKLEENRSANDMILNAFKGFPGNLLEAKLSGKPEFDSATKKLRFPVALSVNSAAYNAFADNLFRVLTPIAGKSRQHTFPLESSRWMKNGITISGDFGGFIRKYGYKPNSEPGIIFVARRINDARTNGIWESVEIEAPIIINIFNEIADNIPRLTVEIVDDDGLPIVSENRAIPFPFLSHQIGSDHTGWKKIERMSSGFSALSIFPLLNSQRDISPYSGKYFSNSNPGVHEIWPGTKSIDIPFEFDASPEEMKMMRNVKCTIQ